MAAPSEPVTAVVEYGKPLMERNVAQVIEAVAPSMGVLVSACTTVMRAVHVNCLPEGVGPAMVAAAFMAGCEGGLQAGQQAVETVRHSAQSGTLRRGNLLARRSAECGGAARANHAH